jgi:hypothetical protein
MPSRIRCQVIEVPSQDDWLAQRGRGGPRELLPWADPYIATLMRKLEGRGGLAEGRGERVHDFIHDSDPFADQEEIAAGSVFDDGWQEDAFMPPSSEAPRFHTYPPVFGGFPLLENE